MSKKNFLNLVVVVFLLIISLFKKSLIQDILANYPGTLRSRLWGDEGSCDYGVGENPVTSWTIYIDDLPYYTDSEGAISKYISGGNHTVAVTIPPDYVLRTSCAGVTNPKTVGINGGVTWVNFPLMTVTPAMTVTPTPCPALGAPSNLQVSCSSPNQANISWTAGANASMYAVRIDDYDNLNDRANELGGTPNDCTPHDVCISDWGSTGMSVVVTPGISFDWWIHSRDNCGNWNPAGQLFGPTFSCVVPTPTATRTPTPTATRTPTPTITPTRTPTPSATRTPTPTITPTGTITPSPTGYEIYGWVYREANNNPPTREIGESLLANYTVNLSGDKSDTTTTQGSPIPGYTANYLFSDVYNGNFFVSLVVTPTLHVLYPGYTNPQRPMVAGGDIRADFPFITITPTLSPTRTPTPTTAQPTPTSIPLPTQSVPTPTGGCVPLPTPGLTAPTHELCTKVKPTFAAYVQNPNGDAVLAHFYSNSFEKFDQRGSVQPASGGNSTWTPYSGTLNYSGSYWWTAYTEAPSCPKSNDAPAWLINMDYRAAPQPTPPSCTLLSQDLYSGICTFSCSWPADPEPTPASCADTSGYDASFWTSLDPNHWSPEPTGSSGLSQIIYTDDGAELFADVKVRDSLNNESPLSAIGGPFTCPRLDWPMTPTPGGPTLTPSPTPLPSGSPTPSITLTPTPGAWLQVFGGDVYQRSIHQEIPAGFYFLNVLTTPTPPTSSGVIWSTSEGDYLPGQSSLNQWEVVQGSGLSNAYNFSYYWESLKNKAITIQNAVVGEPADLTSTDNIYSYSGLGHYTLSPDFKWAAAPNSFPKTAVTIFLISGTLEIANNFTINNPVDAQDNSVIFIVNGNIYIDGEITQVQGMFLSSQTLTVANGTLPIQIDGMLYARNLSLEREYHSPTAPAYKIIYQPQYMFRLLPYLGRVPVKWTEGTP